jgi:hypothetical protein
VLTSIHLYPKAVFKHRFSEDYTSTNFQQESQMNAKLLENEFQPRPYESEITECTTEIRRY